MTAAGYVSSAVFLSVDGRLPLAVVVTVVFDEDEAIDCLHLFLRLVVEEGQNELLSGFPCGWMMSMPVQGAFSLPLLPWR